MHSRSRLRSPALAGMTPELGDEFLNRIIKRHLSRCTGARACVRPLGRKPSELGDEFLNRIISLPSPQSLHRGVADSIHQRIKSATPVSLKPAGIDSHLTNPSLLQHVPGGVLSGKIGISVALTLAPRSRVSLENRQHPMIGNKINKAHPRLPAERVGQRR